MAQIKKSTLFLGVAVLAGLVAAVKFLMPSKGGDANPSVASSDMKDSSAKIVGESATKPTEKPAETMAETPKGVKSVTTKAVYKNPAGEDEVGFTLSVDAMGVIVDAKTDILAVHDISKKRQTAFAEGLPAAVKGKKLSELSSIDKVGGSSLTTKSFNDALAGLKSQL